AGVAPRLRESHRRQWQLEGSGDRHDGDGFPADSRPLELVKGPGEQLAGDLPVEAAHDDSDRPARTGGLALDHAVAVRDPQLAGRVLRLAQPRKLVLLRRDVRS